MTIKVTEIQIVPVKPVNGLVAFASFVFNDSLYLGSVGIMTKRDGSYRLVYPTKKLGGKNLNLFYPINRKVGKAVEKLIVESYEDVMNHDRYGSSNNT